MASGRLVPISISKTAFSPSPADAFDGNADRSEILRQAEIVHLGIDELAQPLRREFHFSF